MPIPDHVPLKFELPPVEGNDRYVIRSRLEIVFILRAIMRKNILVRLYFDAGDSFVLTAILGIDAERGKLIVDCGANEEINQQALRATQLIFIAFHDQARVQFACHGIGKTRFDGRNAYSVGIPENLLRIQRREYYRIATPAVNPLKCALPLAAGHAPDTAEVIVLDISCGGVAVIDHHSRVDFEPGTTYENRCIVLPGISALNVSIQVKSAFEVTLKNGLAGKRSGCEFVAMQEKMLAMIQRYIMKLEGERNTKYYSR